MNFNSACFLNKMVCRLKTHNSTELIKLAKTIYDQTILQQKQGTASLQDVLLADYALREAQQTYLMAIFDYLKADLDLKKFTGNLKSIKI